MKRRVVFRPTASYRSFPIADPKLSNSEVRSIHQISGRWSFDEIPNHPTFRTSMLVNLLRVGDLRKDCDLEDQDPAAIDIVSALSETVVPIVVVEVPTVEADRTPSSYRRSVVDVSVGSNSIAIVPAIVA